MFKRFWAGLRRFFFPPAGSPRWLIVLPYLVIAVVFIALVSGGIYGWNYTNSPAFCGYTCHTMPPQNATYLNSPHANVYCTECHIGRSVLGTQLARKTEDVYELYSMVFHTYTFPLQASRTRPARQTCEQCHQPAAFEGEKLLTISHFAPDQNNTPLNIYLIMKTGGGVTQDGSGMGIHWHVMSKVEYYSPDPLNQKIPFVRVHNADGTVTDYVDTESGIDPAKIPADQLKTVDCVTCHNRVTHDFAAPADSVDSAMASGLISPTIPEIRKKAVEVLSVAYGSEPIAMSGIAGLENYYTQYYTDFHAKNIQINQIRHHGAANHLQPDRVRRSESGLDHASQQPWPHRVARLFPLPRWETYGCQTGSHPPGMQPVPLHPGSSHLPGFRGQYRDQPRTGTCLAPQPELDQPAP